MEQDRIKTISAKSFDFNNFNNNEFQKNYKNKFYETINATRNLKTTKNLNKNFKAFSFSSKKSSFNPIKIENNIESMNKILGKLTNLNKKLNQIKLKRKRNLKLMKLDKPKQKIMCRTETKNKYLLYINDYYKNKLLLKKQKIENGFSDEEKYDTYNRFLNPDFLDFEEINNNEQIQNSNLNNFITIEHKNTIKNDEIISSSKSKLINNSKFSNKNSFNLNNLEIEKKESNKNSLNLDESIIPKIISPKKEKAEEDDNKNNLSQSFLIYKDHINYIKRIRQNELLYLISRYKKSLYKNKLEEMSHIQRFVFPKELITYLIKMKNELIVDKFRVEYFKKLDRYSLNNILPKKTSKNKIINSH